VVSTSTTIWVELEMLEKIRALVRQGKFGSVSEFFRKAAEEYLARLEKEGEGSGRGG